MKSIIINEVKVNYSNATLHSITGSQTTIPGPKEISFNGYIPNRLTSEEVDALMKGKGIKEIEYWDGILEDCFITAYEMSLGDQDDITECNIEGTARNINPYIKVIFKYAREEKKILANIYNNIKDIYRDPEDMTYNEFKDCVMIEEL